MENSSHKFICPSEIIFQLYVFPLFSFFLGLVSCSQRQKQGNKNCNNKSLMTKGTEKNVYRNLPVGKIFSQICRLKRNENEKSVKQKAKIV